MNTQGSMMLDQVVEALCQAEVEFVCVERIDEYTKVESEVNSHQPVNFNNSFMRNLKKNWRRCKFNSM